MDKDQLTLLAAAGILVGFFAAKAADDWFTKRKNNKLAEKRANGRYVWSMYKSQSKAA